MQDAMGRISLLEIESMDRKGGQLREGPITLVLVWLRHLESSSLLWFGTGPWTLVSCGVQLSNGAVTQVVDVAQACEKNKVQWSSGVLSGSGLCTLVFREEL